MRIAWLFLSVITGACASQPVHVVVSPVTRSATLAEILTLVADWQFPEHVSSIDIEVNESGERITLEKTDGPQQIWLSFCGPDENEHREAFTRLLEAHSMQCTWYVGESLTGCRTGYICTNGDTTRDLAEMGGLVLTKVFDQAGNAVMRYTSR